MFMACVDVDTGNCNRCSACRTREKNMQQG